MMTNQKNTFNSDTRLSVCVAAPEMPPVIGGAETFAEVLVLALIRAGVKVYLLTAKSPRPRVIEEIQKNGGSIEVHGDKFEARDGFVAWEWATFSRAEAIHRIVTNHHIDIVHALSHDTIVAACTALAGFSPDKRPSVVATTSEMSTEDNDFGIARSIFVYNLPINGLLQLSRFYLNIALKAGCKPDAACIASAVDTDLFSNGNAAIGRSLLGIDSEAFLLTCPSRFSWRKGQHDLLAALELLPSDLQNRTVCLLAGSTNSASSGYYYDIKTKAENSKVKCLVKEILREDMPDVFAASDLVVMPSYREGLGFAAIESMVAGCPVLLNDVTGFNEIPDSPGQVVFAEAGDVSGLAQCLEKLMTDKDERMAIAKAGQMHAKQAFSPSVFSDKAIRLYRELIHSKQCNL